MKIASAIETVSATLLFSNLILFRNDDGQGRSGSRLPSNDLQGNNGV
jgi:hypothetical protein